LTFFFPKPLLPICGKPAVEATLLQLAHLGCEAAMLNLHHLPEAIPTELGRSQYGMPLLYSHEKEIQGTSGALVRGREFLRGADLALLVNGDALARWPWRALIRRHLRTGADVTLLLHRRPHEEALGGGIGVGSGGRVVRLRDFEATGEVQGHHVFAGAHVISPRILERLVEGPGDIIRDLYQPLLQEGALIQSLTTGRRWHDLGTPDRYLEAGLDQLRSRLPWKKRRSHISPLAELSSDAIVQGSIVEAGAWIGEGVKIARSILMPGARVATGSRIQDSILGPGVDIPSSSNIERRMVTCIPISHKPGPQESIIGSLSYTPLLSSG
jgi:NDP-sugar pyrophosphorylase family protein